ncbi:MAG TPA: RDD family protein, partial [Kofleriaceae bacterium]|nr:RDD family protein [Kofleriaceae bacterium]
ALADSAYPAPSALADSADPPASALASPPADALMPPPLAHTPLPMPAPFADTPLPSPMARTPHPAPPQPTTARSPQPQPQPQPAGRRRDAAAVYVVGFWRRVAAAAIDLAIVLPAALIVTMFAGWITGVHLPGNLHLFDVDLWIDLVLATDPALVMGLVLFAAVGLTYLLVFQIVVGRTLGMRVLRIRIIDVYGDRPSAARCVARCAGYLAGIATLFLGFLWMGFDSEKRGLQDWIAGTYVIRA